MMVENIKDNTNDDKDLPPHMPWLILQLQHWYLSELTSLIQSGLENQWS